MSAISGFCEKCNKFRKRHCDGNRNTCMSILFDTIEALQQENEQLRARVARMRAALILDIKTTIPYEIVYCPKCKYSDFSKTIEYAYTCKNRLSPCRNRIAAANFGCTYGERKESDNDA